MGANGQPCSAIAASENSDRYAAVMAVSAMPRSSVNSASGQANRAAISVHHPSRLSRGDADLQPRPGVRCRVQLEAAVDRVDPVPDVRQTRARPDLVGVEAAAVVLDHEL